MTVAGLNFQTKDATPTASVALNACATAAWSSVTSVSCMQTATVGPEDATAVFTTSALVGTAAVGFSFDGTYRFFAL